MTGTPLNTACGVLALTIYRGRGIKGVRFGGGTADPYVSISIAQRAELARTAVKNST
jgi:Ca2+-dependent lipid-binding protein